MNATTKHNETCTMAFGRPSVHGLCPRCNELRNGAAARKGWGWSKKLNEARTLASITKHDFAACAAKNGCCTCFDW